jgi:hypothetical protein
VSCARSHASSFLQPNTHTPPATNFGHFSLRFWALRGFLQPFSLRGRSVIASNYQIGSNQYVIPFLLDSRQPSNHLVSPPRRRNRTVFCCQHGSHVFRSFQADSQSHPAPRTLPRLADELKWRPNARITSPAAQTECGLQGWLQENPRSLASLGRSVDAVRWVLLRWLTKSESSPVDQPGRSPRALLSPPTADTMQADEDRLHA